MTDVQIQEKGSMITAGKGLKMDYGLGILREVGVGEGNVVVECG